MLKIFWSEISKYLKKFHANLKAKNVEEARSFLTEIEQRPEIQEKYLIFSFLSFLESKSVRPGIHETKNWSARTKRSVLVHGPAKCLKKRTGADHGPVEKIVVHANKS